MPKKLRIARPKTKVIKTDMRKEKTSNPAAEIGSLKKLFEGKTSKELIEEARKEEAD